MAMISKLSGLTGVLGLLALPLAAQDIEFSAEGTDDDLISQLRGASLVLSITEDDEPVAQDYVAAARADYRRLLTALYSDGYYSGTINIRVNGQEAANIPTLEAPRSISTIDISVTPGPRFAFGQTDIGPLPPNVVLPQEFAIGETAKTAVIRQAVSDVITSWQENGFAKAETASQQITARHTVQGLDVVIAIAPGPRLTFGDVTVTGNEDVRTDRILAIAGLPTGAVYSPAEVAKAENRLRKTGAFDSVALIESDTVSAGDLLPFTAQIAEAKPRRFGFGLEFSTIEGLSASTFWLHRNYFGGAENLRVGAEVGGVGGQTGGIDYALTFSFKRPAVLGPDTDFVVSAQLGRENDPDFILDQFAIEATLNRLVREDLEVSGGFGFIQGREQTDAGTRNFTLLTAPLSATLERRDNPVDAKSGYYIDVDATPFISVAGADSGARLFSDIRSYRSFGADDRLTFAVRGQVGTVLNASAEDAPADFLFFSGGGNTVRGQPYNDLSIETLIDDEIVDRGGLSFAGAQLETRFGVTEKIGLVGFYDFARVGEGSNPFGDGVFHAGAGVGVRYDTGIGPIRFDVGTPASGGDAGSSIEVYIGIGQAF